MKKALSTADREKPVQLHYAIKKCPECLAQLALDTDICFSCKQKVGGVDRYGKAKKPVDWKAYTICVLAWTFLGVYVWWAFFRQ